MTTKMYAEALSAPSVIARQLEKNQFIYQELSAFLNLKNPYSTVSVARGSSDHAAQFLNYFITTHLKKLTTSLSMSALTLYQTKIDVSQSAGFAISQSGQSPDVINPIMYMRSQNAPTIALVNDTSSPLAQVSEWVIPLHAEKENSIAATKSFIASLVASASICAHWKKDEKIISALLKLPEDLIKAQKKDWGEAIATLKKAKRIMVVGRGFGLSLAQEAALKLKETCAIQAEAFSAAEIKHGPLAILEEGYPLILFANRGPTLHSMLDLALDLKSKGANVILAAPAFVKEKDLEIQSTHAEELDIISTIQSFYLMVEELSRELGLNPDIPKNLSKITKTK